MGKPATVDVDARADARTRLEPEARRELLLDAAVELVTGGDIETVSMETVAERAGVSRSLVYKHFANRGELLAAVYRREATHLHEQLASDVAAAASVLDMYRSLLRGALRASAERGPVFAALRAAGGAAREVRSEQRQRDATTVRAFARRTEREFGIDRVRAESVTSMLLYLLDPILAQWRVRPTAEQAQLLEDTYMAVVSGSLAALAPRAPKGRPRPAATHPMKRSVR